MNNLSTDETWAVTEFADAELGDLRRTQRLVELATVLAQRPSASLPEACGGDRALLQATYRCFDNAAVAPPELLQSPSDATLLRLSTVPGVVAVQDTTAVDGTAHPTTTGLGPLTHPAHRGLPVHTTLAFTPERVPLGLLAQIGNREADVYDLCLVPRPAGVEVLVRAAWDRRVVHAEQYLWAALAARPIAASLTLQVPRRGAQAARVATRTLRFGPLTLRPPRHRARERLPLMPLWAIQVLEDVPPAEAEPIAWLLLTTTVVPDVATATRCLDWYGGRWGIAVWQKILKSGCQIAARQLGTAEGLERCLVL